MEGHIMLENTLDFEIDGIDGKLKFMGEFFIHSF